MRTRSSGLDDSRRLNVRRNRTLRMAGVAAGFALLAAACGGGGAAGSPVESPSAKDQEKAMLAFAQCMRERGVDMPDPTVDEDGNLGFRGEGHEEAGREDRAEARDACSEEVEGFTQLFDHDDSTESQDQLLAYAACMRENGIDMPDPDFSGGPGEGFQGFHESVDRDDPDVRKADGICREEVFQGQGPGGGGN